MACHLDWMACLRLCWSSRLLPEQHAVAPLPLPLGCCGHHRLSPQAAESSCLLLPTFDLRKNSLHRLHDRLMRSVMKAMP